MKQKNYILKIVPLQPLAPSSPDYFLYFSNKKVPNSSLVKIDFRQKETLGYVLKVEEIRYLKQLIKNLNYQIKPIKEIIIKNCPLLRWQKIIVFKLSRYYYLSLSYSFYLFLGIYKNFPDLPKEKIFKINKKFSLIIKDQLPLDLIKNKKTLIICPTLEEAEIYYNKIKNKIDNLIFIRSLKDFYKHFKSITSFESKIFIGNKNIIFLPWQNIEVVIVTNEGSIFYREFFKIPKINYLEIIKTYAQIEKCQLVYLSNFYSLSTYLKNKKLALPRLEFKNFKNISSLIELIKEGVTNKIFILQKSLGSRLICLNCYWQKECENCGSYLTVFEDKLFCHYCHRFYPLIKICPYCQEELSLKTIGKQWLKNFLIRRQIQFYEINNERDLIKFKKENPKKFIVLGSWHILNLFSENSFFINFDIGFFSENLFLKEKYLRLAHYLKNSSTNIFLHTKLTEEILNKIKTGIIINDLLKERKINKLPPYYYQSKLISRFSNLEELNKRLLNLKEELKKRIINERDGVEILGPFLEKIIKIKKRYQMYLLIRSKIRLNFKKILRDLKYLEEIKFDDEEF